MQLQDLVDDPRYSTNEARTKHRAELVELLGQRFNTAPSARWTERLTAANVPFGPIQRVDQVFRDSQTLFRGLSIDLPHAQAATVPSVANPIRFSDTPVAYRYGPPVLGQHSREVLSEWLGMAEDEFDDLASRGVL
jgi:crotonobetainyl-CoA:carnitine CoA-transferase CaiB-like acyl-CoA transferase